MFKRRLPRSPAARPAQAVVEFALVLPVLVLMLAGIYDLANGYQTYIALTNAAREGAHLGINNNSSSAICARVQAVVSVTLDSCNVYYGAYADGSCNASATTRTLGQPICVQVTYTLPTLMGGVLGFGSILITTQATLIVFST